MGLSDGAHRSHMTLSLCRWWRGGGGGGGGSVMNEVIVTLLWNNFSFHPGFVSSIRLFYILAKLAHLFVLIHDEQFKFLHFFGFTEKFTKWSVMNYIGLFNLIKYQ